MTNEHFLQLVVQGDHFQTEALAGKIHWMAIDLKKLRLNQSWKSRVQYIFSVYRHNWDTYIVEH